MIHVGDGTWNLRIFITDLQVEKTLRVRGDLHIGGVMLKLVDPGLFLAYLLTLTSLHFSLTLGYQYHHLNPNSKYHNPNDFTIHTIYLFRFFILFFFLSPFTLTQ